jgi:serine/threonine protein kinase/Flp pilus assembly protein TadD
MPQPEKIATSGTHADRGEQSIEQRSSSGSRSSSGRADLSEHGELDPALVDLFDQITGWLQSGEAVEEERLVAQHPGWANEIRTLLPTLREIARAGELRKADLAPPLADERDARGRRVIGDFHIVREIGRGGMGIVYEAEQVKLGRRVALKILPIAATLDPRAIQRFQLEAQVAGWLQHPRIVPVYAVGMVNEAPFFAMQLIEGGSLASLIGELRDILELDDHSGTATSSSNPSSGLALGMLTGRFAATSLDHNVERQPQPSPPSTPLVERSNTKSRPTIQSAAYLRTVVRLGIQAAEALGYAHDQGIIHRDIKPANLLLDRKGDLWVADFGMADVQGNAGVTRSGDLPGTLRYMSPEQATGQRAIVDRRTDIYSLGATLYELLTLQPAVPGPDKVELLRRISDEEPVPIRRLNRAVPVDLATIVNKAIAKDPTNRYETAIKLADDLTRFLDGRPIAARPVGPMRRTWRWCRRKPVQASLAASLVLALLGGFAGITWNWRDAVRQRQLADLQKSLVIASRGEAQASEKKAVLHAAKADAINDFLINKLLRQAAPEHNPASKRVTLLEVLDRAAATVGTSFPDQPEIETAIRLTLGETYHDLGDYPKSETHYRAAYERLKNEHGENDPATLDCASKLGHILTHLHRHEEAETLLTSAVDQAKLLHGPEHEATLLATSNLAGLVEHLGRSSEAEALYRQLLKDNLAIHGPKHPETIAVMNNLGTVLEKQQKYTEAERLFREHLDLAREVHGAEHPAMIPALFNLGFILFDLGRIDEAEKWIRQSIDLSTRVKGPDNPETIEQMNQLGLMLLKQGRLEEAEKLRRPWLEAQRQAEWARSKTKAAPADSTRDAKHSATEINTPSQRGVPPR